MLQMASDSSGQCAKTFLALGDSYTIGESVPVYDNFPYQTVKLLRQKGINVTAPEIVAKTGWTTDELLEGISKSVLKPKYDIVTVLIGVNNQYRGRSLGEFGTQYEIILKKAIAFAGGNKQNIYVLSIPDWGITPFAEGRDRKKISEEIDAFNKLKEQITLREGIKYINITEGTREATLHPEFLAKDKLHPSGKDYLRWAEKIVSCMKN